MKPMLKFLFLSLFLSTTIPLNAKAQLGAPTVVAGFREESSVLEEIYSQKARSVLNSLMAEDDYTLVVSVTVKKDDERVKLYRQELEKSFLPGLAIQDPNAFTGAENLLHDLKDKATVQVVIGDNVSSDRDAIVRDVLKSKLKLNEETGDALTVTRASPTVVKNPTDQPKKLAELSGRMIAFLIILTVIALAALGLWLWRREKLKEQEPLPENNELKEAIADEAGPKAPTPGSPEAISAAEEERKRQAEIELKIINAKNEILKNAKQYGTIVCKSAEEFFKIGKDQELTLVFESYGWENSRKIFDGVDHTTWAGVGQVVRERTQDPSRESTLESLVLFNRFALSYILERAPRNAENPFAFLFELPDAQRIDVLAQESAHNVALIAIYCSGTQMTELLEGVHAEKQHQVLIEMTKIKQLPEKEVSASVGGLLAKLEHVKRDPSVYASGPHIAVSFLRSLDPLREEELVQKLWAQHPTEAESLRRATVMFFDIPKYPKELTESALDNIENDDWIKMLTGFPADIREDFLNLLPTKRSAMLQGDLLGAEGRPFTAQGAIMRRKLVKTLESVFNANQFKLEDFWKNQGTVTTLRRENSEPTRYETNSDSIGIPDDDSGTGQAA